jgi:hypothetical protein
MQVFYLVVFLQRYLPLCPRVSLDPQDNGPLPQLVPGIAEGAAIAD